MAAKATPGLIGYDLFFTPGWLTWICETCFNKAVAAQVDSRRRNDQERVRVEENVRIAQQNQPYDAETERQRRLDAINRRAADKAREQ